METIGDYRDYYIWSRCSKVSLLVRRRCAPVHRRFEGLLEVCGNHALQGLLEGYRFRFGSQELRWSPMER